MKFFYTFFYHIVIILESIFLGWYILGIVVPLRLNEESYIAQEKLEGFLDKLQPIKNVIEFMKKQFAPNEEGDGGFQLPDFSGLFPRRKRQLPGFVKDLFPDLPDTPPRFPERSDILETFQDIRQFNTKTMITSIILVIGQLVSLAVFAVGRGTKTAWLLPVFVVWTLASTAYLDFVCVRELRHDFSGDTRLIKVPPPESRPKIENSITVFIVLRTAVTVVGLLATAALVVGVKKHNAARKAYVGGVVGTKSA